MKTKTKPKRTFLLKTKSTKDLLKKLKSTKMPLTTIATRLGYKSHNTIKHWFTKGAMPESRLADVRKLVRG